jgi:hypothetical protein
MFDTKIIGVYSDRTCAAMDFNPTATPLCLATEEIHHHACLHRPLPSFMAYA